jgi:archaellum component FlaD/FlaE
MSPQKPYLETVDPEPGRVEAVIEWMEYLATTFGTSGALNALEYYERIGWISPQAREGLLDYLRGLGMDELHNKKYDEPGTLEGPLASLSGTPFGAHARSLEYVAAIAGDDLEAELLLASMAEQRAKPDGQSGWQPRSAQPGAVADGGANAERRIPFDDSMFGSEN